MGHATLYVPRSPGCGREPALGMPNTRGEEMGVNGVKCWVALVCCCLLLCQLTTATPVDYDTLNDMYDLLAVHEVERRAPPSMRLRFGKRDMGWQVAQRSMPTLRLRFGKRNVDEADPILDHHDLIRKDARTPALRLRFGKRGASFGEEDMASQEQ